LYSRFKSYQDYQIHITEEHEGKCTFKCGQCEEIFAIKDDLLLHRFQVHKILSRGFKGHQNLQVKDRICEICGKVIKGNLSQHVRTIHEGFDEQVSCDTCGKVFKSKSHLGAHIRTSHKKLPCEICGIMIPVGLKARHYQQAHVKKEDRKFKCEICGKGFALSHNLKDHMNTHTGARPYVCKFCGKDFASAGNHRMHEKSHMGFKRNGK
jgi:transcription elongation factor Elf1